MEEPQVRLRAIRSFQTRHRSTKRVSAKQPQNTSDEVTIPSQDTEVNILELPEGRRSSDRSSEQSSSQASPGQASPGQQPTAAKRKSRTTTKRKPVATFRQIWETNQQLVADELQRLELQAERINQLLAARAKRREQGEIAAPRTYQPEHQPEHQPEYSASEPLERSQSVPSDNPEPDTSEPTVPQLAALAEEEPEYLKVQADRAQQRLTELQNTLSQQKSLSQGSLSQEALSQEALSPQVASPTQANSLSTSQPSPHKSSTRKPSTSKSSTSKSSPAPQSVSQSRINPGLLEGRSPESLPRPESSRSSLPPSLPGRQEGRSPEAPSFLQTQPRSMPLEGSGSSRADWEAAETAEALRYLVNPSRSYPAQVPAAGSPSRRDPFAPLPPPPPRRPFPRTATLKSLRKPEGRWKRLLTLPHKPLDRVGDAVLWMVLAAVTRLGLKFLSMTVPLLTPFTTLLMLTPALVAVYLAVFVPNSGSIAIYRLFLVMLGLLLGGRL